MSRVTKRIAYGIFAALLSVLVMGAHATPAWATDYDIGHTAYHQGNLKQVTNGKTLTVYLDPLTGKSGGRLYGAVYIWKWTNNFTNVKVGNKNVIVAGNKYVERLGSNTKKGMQLWFMPRKVGKTTLTYTFKGKTHKVNIVVKSWVKNPIKRLVVSGKTIAPSKGGSEYVYKLGNKHINGKSVKVTAATGWKVMGIYEVDDRGYDSTKIKNPGKMYAYYNYVHIIMKNTKTGGLEDVILHGINS